MCGNMGYSIDSHIHCILVLWQTVVCQGSCARTCLISHGWTMYSATVRQLILFHHYSCRISPWALLMGVRSKCRFSVLNMTLQCVINIDQFMSIDQFISEEIPPWLLLISKAVVDKNYIRILFNLERRGCRNLGPVSQSIKHCFI